MFSKKQGYLRRAFKGVAFGTALFVAGLPATVELQAWIGDVTRVGGDALTQGEKDLVHGIFGNQVDTSSVRKHFGPKKGNYAATVEDGSSRHINFWGERWHSKDYSTDWVVRRSVFMHEVTHLWQHQNHLLVLNGAMRGCKIYEYELESDSHFDDFCLEQQASIIGDYIKVLYGPRFMMLNEQDRLTLFRVVEDKFPQARMTRLGYEQQAENDGKSIAYNAFAPSV